jgi:hypothetical protein
VESIQSRTILDISSFATLSNAVAGVSAVAKMSGTKDPMWRGKKKKNRFGQVMRTRNLRIHQQRFYHAENDLKLERDLQHVRGQKNR